MNDDRVVDPAGLLEALGQAVIVTDADGIIRIWNSAATRVYGWSSDEVVGRPVLEVTPARDSADDAARLMVDLRSGESWSGELDLRRRDGQVFPASVTVTPLRDERGEVTAVIGVSEDITGRRRQEAELERILEAEAAARSAAEVAGARMQLLADAMVSMTESLAVRPRLKRLAEVIVPWLADGCALYLLDDDGQPVLEVVHHVDPAVVAAVRSLDARYPANLDAPVGTGAAIRERRTSWIPEVTPEIIATAVRDDAQLAEVKGLGLRSGVAVPLIGRDVVIGAASLFTTTQRCISDKDVVVAEDLCARAGTVLENAQLMEARAEDGRRLRFQSSLLQAQNEAGVEGNLVVDAEGRVLSYNRRFLEIWELVFDEVEGGDDDSLLEQAVGRVADPDAFMARVREIYRTRPRLTHDEIVLSDGRVLDRYGAPLRGPEGEYFGWAWYVRDISPERERQAQIAAMGEQFAALARTLQQSLLPPALPTMAGIDLAARYHPALEGLEVGGDFYDVFRAGPHWMVVMGDVCGKGAQAAALTALVRYTVRAAAVHDDDPATVLTELNAAMLADNPDEVDGRFATVCCIRLTTVDEQVTATIACGGHPPPLVCRTDGRVEPVGSYGTVLGLLPKVEIAATTTVLAAGDALVALTDGVLEARNSAGEQLEEAGVIDILRTERPTSALAAAELLEQRAIAHQGGVARDDIAVVVARVLPQSQ